MSIRQCARTMRHTVLIAAMFAAATSTSLAAAEKRQFEVAAGSAVQALNEFGRQANIQLLFDSDAVRGLRTRGVSGQLEVADALAQLLGGTSLVFDFVNERTVVVMLQGALPKNRRTSGTGRANGSTRLVQAEDRPSQAASSAASAARSESLEQQRIALEEIIVTGTNIRGVYPSSSPVQTYTAADIARTGATTTEQFILKLPQNLGTRSPYASAAVGQGDRLNTDSVAGVDLRGLGIGTSLVLMNGRRLGHSDIGRTADVSLIPTSAIERVEVLTDGASAIYGSDAIGGVVNFVLRDNFDGAETNLSYGSVASGHLQQMSFTQTLGERWSSGNGLVSYNYFDATALKVADRDYASAAQRGTLTPDDRRHNVLATFSQDLSKQLELSGDFTFARRDVESGSSTVISPDPLNHDIFVSRSETEQLFANLSLDYRITDALNASLLATYSEADVKNLGRASVQYNRVPPVITTFPDREQSHSVLDVTAMFDGALFALPGGDVRFSVGGGLLDEGYEGRTSFSAGTAGRLARRTSYAFGEFFLPFVDAGQAVPLVRRLELSAAVRYTNYSDRSEPSLNRDFGDATDPKIGLLWAPFDSLGLRATYGTSFRAPSLVQLDETGGANNLFSTRIPRPNGPVATLFRALSYAVPDLGPETAETYTIGFDFRPQVLPRLELSGTYYKVSYTDRIATAPTDGVRYLESPELYPDAIYRPASAEFIEAILRTTTNNLNLLGLDLSDPQAAASAIFAMPNVWFHDLRLQNLARSEQDGFDISIDSRFDMERGEIRLGGNVSYILDYEQQASGGSLVANLVDVATQPVDLRSRIYAGLSRGGFDCTVSVNYIDDYTNPFPITGPEDIDSWTTVDVNLSYEFGEEISGLLGGVRLNLGIQNLFDEDPPFLSGGTVQALLNPVGFDPANANPLGRFIAVTVAKTW